MGKFCAAYGCTNSSDKTDCKLKNISFHRFPLKDSNRLKLWLVKVKRENFKPTKHSVLCSEHFNDEDFENVPPSNKRRSLKPETVPSNFSFSKAAVKRKRTCHQIRTPSPTSSMSDDDSSFETGIACQTETDVVSALLVEIQQLRDEILFLKRKVYYHSLHVETLSDSDLKILIGFNKIQFETIYSFLNFKEDNDSSLSMKQKLYIFFVRLKTGLTEETLAVVLRTSQSSISRIILMLTGLIYDKVSCVNIWPSKEQNKYYMPYLFQLNFPNCRIIVDSTEFEIQKPSDPKIQQLTFSNYKSRNTIKCLIGIVPSGAIALISEAWGGSVSDKEIFLKSNVLNLLEPGDAVLVAEFRTIYK